MKSQHAAKGLMAILAVIMAVSVLPTQAGQVQTMIPEDVAICAYVADYTKLDTQWKSTYLYKFFKDPEVENFIIPLKRQLDALSKEMEAGGGKPLISYFQGEMAFVVGAPTTSQKGLEVPLMMVVEHNAKPEEIQTSIKKFIERQGKVSEPGKTDFMGVPIYSMKVTTEGATAPTTPGAPGAPQLASGQTLDYNFIVLPKHFIITEGSDTLIKQTVQLGKQSSDKTVFNSSGFKNSFTGDFSKFPAIVYVNMTSVFTGLDTFARQNGTPGIKGFGLESISSFGVALTMEPKKIESWTVIYAPGPKTGVAKLLFPSTQPNFDQALTLIPYDAMSFSVSTFSLAEVWTLAKQGVTTFVPQYAPFVDMYIQQINMNLQIDIERDLLGSLGNEFVQYAKAGAQAQQPAPGALSPAAASKSIFMVSLKDSAKFKGTLVKLLEYLKQSMGGQDMLEKVEFMGETIYKQKTNPQMGAMPGMPVPGFVVTSKSFVFGTDVDELKQVVRAMQGKGVKNILTDNAFKTAYASMKAPNLKSIGYTSSKAIEQVSMALQGMAMLAQAGMAPNSGINNFFNFASVPGPEVFSKYFGDQYNSSKISGDKIIGHSVMNAAN